MSRRLAAWVAGAVGAAVLAAGSAWTVSAVTAERESVSQQVWRHGQPSIRDAVESSLQVDENGRLYLVLPSGEPELRYAASAALVLAQAGQLDQPLLDQVAAIPQPVWRDYLTRESEPDPEWAHYPAYFAIWQWDRLNEELRRQQRPTLPMPPEAADLINTLVDRPAAGVNRLWLWRLRHLAPAATPTADLPTCQRLAATVRDPFSVVADGSLSWLPDRPSAALCRGDQAVLTAAIHTSLQTALSDLRTAEPQLDWWTVSMLHEVATIVDPTFRPPPGAGELRAAVIAELERQVRDRNLYLDVDDLAYLSLLPSSSAGLSPLFTARLQLVIISHGRAPQMVTTPGFSGVIVRQVADSILGQSRPNPPHRWWEEPNTEDLIELLAFRKRGEPDAQLVEIAAQLPIDDIRSASVVALAYAEADSCTALDARSGEFRSLLSGTEETTALADVDYLSYLSSTLTRCGLAQVMPPSWDVAAMAVASLDSGSLHQVRYGVEALCALAVWDEIDDRHHATVRRHQQRVVDRFISGAGWRDGDALLDLYSAVRLHDVLSAGCGSPWWRGLF
jgi:hypothetical protein